MGLFSKKTKDSASSADKEEKKLVKTGEVKVEKKAEKEKKEKTEMVERKVEKSSKEKKHASAEAQKILIRPLMTEKSTFLGAENKYVFEVSGRANKTEIAKAIHGIYQVKPIKINIINSFGKKIRTNRGAGKTKDWKKAIVTLKAGEKIEVYEGV
jgi:large subunit ribosomal protein L23